MNYSDFRHIPVPCLTWIIPTFFGRSVTLRDITWPSRTLSDDQRCRGADGSHGVVVLLSWRTRQPRRDQGAWSVGFLVYCSFIIREHRDYLRESNLRGWYFVVGLRERIGNNPSASHKIGHSCAGSIEGTTEAYMKHWCGLIYWLFTPTGDAIISWPFAYCLFKWSCFKTPRSAWSLRDVTYTHHMQWSDSGDTIWLIGTDSKCPLCMVIKDNRPLHVISWDVLHDMSFKYRLYTRLMKIILQIIYHGS